MNEVIRGYLSGYKIASLLARRVLASLSRWPNLSSSPPPSPFAVAIVLLKTIRASSGSRVSEGGGCWAGGSLASEGRHPRHGRCHRDVPSGPTWLVGRLDGALCSLPPKAFLLPPLF